MVRFLVFLFALNAAAAPATAPWPKMEPTEPIQVPQLNGLWKNALIEHTPGLTKRYYRMRLIKISKNDIQINFQFFDKHLKDKVILEQIIKGTFTASYPKGFPKLVFLNIATKENKIYLRAESALIDAMKMRKCARPNIPFELTTGSCGDIGKQTKSFSIVVSQMDSKTILASVNAGLPRAPKKLGIVPLIKQ
jgi:hypothetical protein